jgi:single-stranded-DNA-specific exonuclease
MKRLQAFEAEIKKQSDAFFSKVKDDSIKVISHLDADGLSAAAVLTDVLARQKKRFTVSIVPSIEQDSLDKYIFPNDKHIILTDLGSGQLNLLKKNLSDRNILILDHHEIETKDFPDNFFHLNPRTEKIDGNSEMSGAGVAYYWARHILDDASHLSKMALIGAIGDIQVDNDISVINKDILSHAEDNNHMVKKKTLRFYGAHSKPLPKLLANTDVEIPGINRNLAAAERLLMELGINTTIGDITVKLCDLTTSEVEKLTAAVIQKREGLETPKDIFWDSYLICGEKDGTLRRDAREVATLLNACGRLSKPSIGIGLLLNDKKCLELAAIVTEAYKKKLIEAIKWYRMNKKSDSIIEKDNIIVINAKDRVLGTMIGTLASIVSNDKQIEKGTYILSLAHIENDKTKVSLRVAKDRSAKLDGEYDLSGIVRSVVEKIGSGQAGGHAMAAGAVIERGVEDKFIEVALDTFASKETKTVTVPG